MRDSYIYFKEIGHSISVQDFARMFGCSTGTARRAIDGTHPAYDDNSFRNKIIDLAPPAPKRPVGRPRKITTDVCTKKRKTHCRKGHEFSVDNVYSYKTASGFLRRKCLTCRNEYGREYYLRTK